MEIRKLFTLLLLWLTAATTVWADNISEEQALELASRVMAYDGHRARSAVRKAPRMVRPKLAYKAQWGQRTDLYVFNDESTHSFVIVAGDDVVTNPVLGYCDNGTFDYENAPCALKAMLSRYSIEINDLRRHPAKAAKLKARAAQATGADNEGIGEVIVAPFLKTRWSQYAPYNDLCPKNVGDGRGCTGCVITAMAQIMNYWQWPVKGRGKHSYHWNPTIDTYCSLSGSFSNSVYDWANMIDDYSNGYTEAQGHAVAVLMRDLGIAFEARYGGEEGTSAAPSEEPLKRFFDYKIAPLKEPVQISEDTYDITEVLHAELEAHRPFYRSVLLTPEDFGLFASHGVVCDGYTSNGFYHYSLGWGGQADGYYQFLGMGGLPIYGIVPAYSESKDGICYQVENGEAIVSCIDLSGEVTIPATFTNSKGEAYPVTAIGEQACMNNDTLTAVVLPDDIRTIGKQAFSGCTSLSSINVPAQIDYLGEAAFAGTAIQTFTIPATIKRIPTELFYHSQLSQVTIQEGVATIGEGAFEGCPNLNTVELPASVFTIEDRALRCNLQELHLPHHGITVGNHAITAANVWPESIITKLGDYGMSGIKNSSVILDEIEEMGDYALTGSIQSIHIGPKLRKMGKCAIRSHVLEKITVDEGNNNFVGVDGALYSKDMNTLYLCSSYKQDSYSYGPRDEFMVPEGVTVIDSCAFQGCSGLYNLTIPASVETIPDRAFYACEKLVEVYNYAPQPQAITAGTFNVANRYSYNQARLHVLPGCKEAYQAVAGWAEFGEIVEDLEENLIGDDPESGIDPDFYKNALYVVLGSDNGYYNEFLFSKNPVLTYDLESHYDEEGYFLGGREYILTSDDADITIHYSTDMVRGIEFRKVYDPTGIDDIRTDDATGKNLRFKVVGNTIEISGLAAGSSAALYSVDGLMFSSATADGNGRAVLYVTGTSGTIYVVKAGSTSFKVQIKK